MSPAQYLSNTLSHVNYNQAQKKITKQVYCLLIFTFQLIHLCFHLILLFVLNGHLQADLIVSVELIVNLDHSHLHSSYV